MKFKKIKKVKPENFGITNYRFNSDGTLDVFENVYLDNMRLKELPFNFGQIIGNFSCYHNELTSLKGAPNKVDGNFDCSENQFKNLKYAPEKINGWFDCNDTGLTSLEGSPKIINGYFNCNHNELKTLEGAPEIINGSFWCNWNKLTTLEGLNLDSVFETIEAYNNPNLKLTEKEELWATLNPGRLILK